MTQKQNNQTINTSFKNTFTKQKIIGKRVATSVTKPYVPDIMVMLGDEAKSPKENVHPSNLFTPQKLYR